MIIGYTFDGVSYPAAPFAQMIDELLDHNEGVINGIELSNTTTKITIGDGRLIIKGRAFEIKGGEEVEVTATQSGELYCILVAEIDLSKESSDSSFKQVELKYIASASNYPTLTQQDINNTASENGIYQFELARFKNSVSGLKNFEDTRTFLSLDGIFTNTNIKTGALINDIQQELVNVKDGSAYFLKATQLTNQDLNTLTTEGYYYASGGNACLNKPEGINDFGLFVKRIASGKYKQTIDYNDVTYTRYYSSSVWTSWVKTITNGDFAVIKGVINTTAATSSTTVFNSMQIDFPAGFNSNNCVVISWGIHHKTEEEGVYGKAFGYTNPSDSRTWLRGAVASMVTLDHQGNNKITFTLETPFTQAYTYEFEIVLMKIAKPEVTLLGDANCDGVVNSADATLIQNYVQGKASLNLQGFVNADVTKDGDVKSSDYLKVKDYVDGKISSLN